MPDDTANKPLDAAVPPPETKAVAPPAEEGHPVYYSKIEVVGNPPEIRYERVASGLPPPPEYRNLRRQIEDVARLVRILFQDDAERLKKFMDTLRLTADSGLCGVNCDPSIGADNLEDAKLDIAEAFPAVRSKIWWWNTVILVGVVAICGAASGASYYYRSEWFPDLSAPAAVWPFVVLAAFLIPLGVSIGLFVEFVFRVNDDVPYDQLRAINPGRWKPIQRAINTVIVGYVFAGILGIGAIQVGAGGVLLNEYIDKKPIISLFIGFLTGFAFPYVRDLLQQVRPVQRDAPKDP
jgi:hypothetical protein